MDRYFEEKVILLTQLLQVLILLLLIKMPLRISKKHVELAGRWLPSAMVYGTSTSMALLYFTDWKVIVTYIPFYGGKFKD